MPETDPDPPPPAAPATDAGPPPHGDAGDEAQPSEAATDGRPGCPPEAVTAGDVPIPDATLEYWAGQDDDARADACEQLNEYYETLLDEFRTSANEFVAQYKDNADLGRRWRFWLILLTGGLALVNVLASSWPDGWDGAQVRGCMTFGAAVYAVLLALATNVESFHNYADKKLSARDSRELFLDAYREFEMLRLTHVNPFGSTPQGCFNLHALYRRLVAKDAELRRKLKQLTVTGDRAPAGQKSA
jgi:hypothetical protein